MKVYLVIGYHENDLGTEVESRTSLFGVFSTEEKAMNIKYDILKNFKEAGEEININITQLTIDKPTESYEFFMNN